MNLIILILLLSKVDVDIGGKLGILYADEIDSVLGFDGLAIDRASVEVKADLFDGVLAEIEVDFADRMNLKTARVRCEPLDYLSIWLGHHKIPVSREELTGYFSKSFLQHSQGNRWADDADYLGRSVGIVLKANVPLGEHLEISPQTGVFVSPSGTKSMGAGRVELRFGEHELGLNYSSRETLFAQDSLLLGLDLHLDFPVSCDAEAVITPNIQAFSVLLESSFLDNHLKQAIRYEWFINNEDPRSPTPELGAAFAWQTEKLLKIQADIIFPLKQDSTTEVRIFAGIKANF